jgi:NTP pyrophosphatase (non-canonical NTP hydrolase)
MKLNKYQEKAKETAIFPSVTINGGSNKEAVNYIYPALGLVGEAGEVAEKIKKLIRDKGGLVEEKDRELLKKELGDVLWYIAALADVFQIELEDIAKTNIDKLKSRQERNKINGSGDER